MMGKVQKYKTMTLSFWQSLTEYQLPYSQEQELHKAVALIADHLHGFNAGPSEEKYKLLQQYGTDIMDKYTNIYSLSETALKAIITENGYGYIVELLDLNIDQLRGIVYYLPLIQALKGTIPGLEIMLSTFCDQLTLTEWWQDESGSMPPHTMNIDIIRLKNMKIRTGIHDAIIRFCGEYIYPLITSVDVHLSFTDGNTNKSFIRCDISDEITVQVPEIIYTTLIDNELYSTVNYTPEIYQYSIGTNIFYGRVIEKGIGYLLYKNSLLTLKYGVISNISDERITVISPENN